MSKRYSAAEVIKDRECSVNDKVWIKLGDNPFERAVWDYNYIAAFILVILLGILYGVIDLGF